MIVWTPGFKWNKIRHSIFTMQIILEDSPILIGYMTIRTRHKGGWTVERKQKRHPTIIIFKSYFERK